MEGIEEEQIPRTHVGIVRREAKKTWRVIIKKGKKLFFPSEYSFGFTGFLGFLQISMISETKMVVTADELYLEITVREKLTKF